MKSKPGPQSRPGNTPGSSVRAGLGGACARRELASSYLHQLRINLRDAAFVVFDSTPVLAQRPLRYGQRPHLTSLVMDLLTSPRCLPSVAAIHEGETWSPG